MFYVMMYLAAIVLANMTVDMFGPWFLPVNSAIFIGLTLTARDRLHDMWGDNLRRNMAALIAAGALLSWALGAGQIAVASGLAFAAAETADAVGYHWLRGRYKLLQINGSNVPAAIVDTLVFLGVAFGMPYLWPVVLSDIVAKVGGGFVWSIVLNWREAAAVLR